MTNDLDTIPRKKLTKRQLAELSSFTDPAVILSLLSKYDWNIEKSIQNLVDIATNATKEATRLAAIRYLNTLQLEAMQRAGMIVTARGHIGPQGEEITFTGQVISNSLKSQKEAPAEETKIDEIMEVSVITKEETNAEVHEENKEKEEGQGSQKVGEEILKAEPADVDMHVAKYPEGKHEADGQFGGIATASSSPPSTIHIL